MALRATEILPDTPAFLDTLGWVYVKLNRNPEAIEVLRPLREMDPENMIAGYHLGVALHQNGEIDAAKELFEVVLKRSPPPEIEGVIRELLSASASP